MDGIRDDGGGNDGGDDVWDGGPTADSSSHQDTCEQDGGEEQMTSVFCRCERTRCCARLSWSRVERDVLDVVNS